MRQDSRFSRSINDKVTQNLEKVLNRPVTPLDLWVAFEMLRRNNELPKAFDPKTILDGEMETGSFISNEELKKIRFEDFLSDFESFRAALNEEGALIDLDSNEEEIVGCLVRLNNGKGEENGLFKFFYKTTYEAIDVYGGSNPLKVFGIMSVGLLDEEIKIDILRSVLFWSFDRHLKEQRFGKGDILKSCG